MSSPQPQDNKTPASGAGTSSIERIQLKKWNVVAEWGYSNAADNCSICHNALTDQCLQCYKGSTEGECLPVWGKCSHSFHFHCMAKWITKQQKCPLCSAEWVMETK
eukprot:UN02034